MDFEFHEGEDITKRIKLVGAAIITAIIIETAILLWTNWITFCG